jgi:uncharacterized protein YidB (DUF937 family)
MGLFEQVSSAVSGIAGKGQEGGVNAVLLPQLMSLLSKPGAMDKVMSAFQSSGLGNVLQSWIGTGQNLPISADQVRSVLGDGMISDLAKRSGIGEAETSQALSGLLPQVVDKLTPDGALPSKLDFGGLSSSLGKLLG